MNDLKRRCRGRIRLCTVSLTLGVIAGAVAEPATADPDAKPAADSVARRITVSPQARRNIVNRVLTHPTLAQQAPAHRLAVIRLTLESATGARGVARTVAVVVLFDHTAGEARRVLLDVDDGKLLANTPLPGRPQGSREEVAEAARIIRRDPGLARQLDEGGVLDGGFIVADPGGSRRRLMQLKLLSPNRLTLLRSITVDLTRGVIANPEAEDGAAGASRAIRPAADRHVRIR
jgi:hypothetical protein